MRLIPDGTSWRISPHAGVAASFVRRGFMRISQTERPAAGPTLEGTVNLPSPPAVAPRRLRAPSTWLRPRQPKADGEAAHAEQIAPRRRVSAHALTFLLLVALPSVAFIIYLAFFASNQYIAVSRLAVRSSAFDQPVDLPANPGINRSPTMSMVVGQDAYIIVAYIKSHKIIEDISKTLDLREVYRHPSADFWERLPKSASAEEMLTYWNKRVQASVDGASGIVTVRVRAFTPDDAVKVLTAIISASEKLANDVSARARRETVQRAEEEVNQMMGRAQSALNDLQKFRERVGFIDPVSSATMANSLIMQILAEKIRAESELYIMQRLAPDNATGQRVLRTSIESMQQQIDRLKETLTGQSEEGRSVAAALVEYERLEMQRVLSQKLLTLAQESLQRAAQRADRQNIYVTTFVPPSSPQESEYPRPFQMWLVYSTLMAVAWGVLTLLLATIDDHRI